MARACVPSALRVPYVVGKRGSIKGEDLVRREKTCGKELKGFLPILPRRSGHEFRQDDDSLRHGLLQMLCQAFKCPREARIDTPLSIWGRFGASKLAVCSGIG